MMILFASVVVMLLLLTIPYMMRVIRGPTVFDRVVALNGIGTKVPVLMVFVGLLYGRPDMLVDVALGLFLLNLFTTLLVAKYVRYKVHTRP